ncbi:hypothetical protein FRC02_005872 [Tulasnella sp. 418]|nr:hypothetical protein FRC02_005872 [Tulasnella sp. 418]
MVPPTRRSGRNPRMAGDPLSGSEYQTGSGSPSSVHSPGSPNNNNQDAYQPEAEHELYVSRSGRVAKVKPFKDLTSEDEDEAPIRGPSQRRRLTRGTPARRNSFIEDDENDEEEQDDQAWGARRLRNRNKSNSAGRNSIESQDTKPTKETQANLRAQRASRRAARTQEDTDFVDISSHHSETASDDADHDVDADGSIDDQPPSTPDEHRIAKQAAAGRNEEPTGYGLRKRTNRVDYRLPPPLAPEDIASGNAFPPDAFGPGGPNKARPKSRPPRNVVPWGFSSANHLGGLDPTFGFGIPRPRAVADDSDSDVPTQTPRKPFSAAAGGASNSLFAAGASGTGMLPSDLAAAAGTPSNLGKVGTDSALADADPLGVNPNVTFDEVGGLDDHINSLKEMISLPLLYPEIFQRFKITPPRGVLFHGPPGTGKTLLARALAASSRSGGRGISFFMRKGADVLSKWVGEAERQLRLLFEEAKACQPSIIFFDEIDGLAPVRSSKQDQIHASLVSTLLALMDGMDGRGQVIVIGATNRPDAIDPALRRPGRFDREFYFPLPGLQAREKILKILTREWEGWEGEEGDETRRMLAKATKGYGGADLRAFCTEAALNAVQRRYPQIYKSNDRLLLKPETIQVQIKDFMVSLKKLIPSSARSTASAAAPLPTQLVPLLEENLEKVTTALDRALPKPNNRTALEEAEYEEEADGGFEREMMLQAMETLRVHRPRIVLHGSTGMGQAYIGAAALHHLEGYHVQNLDLGTLMSDPTRTVEATIVQLFVEAKRHKPSVIYIPSLIGWCSAVSEAARNTMKAMLDSVSPTDPLLLLGIVEGDFNSLPRDVRNWFGFTKESRVELVAPDREKRRKFFSDLLAHVQRPPSEFPDSTCRKKRILEELPIAPPLPPRMPSAAEIAAQEENDERLKVMLTHRLGPLLQDLKKKHKRFTKSVREEYGFDDSVPNEEIFIPDTRDSGDKSGNADQSTQIPPAAPAPAPQTIPAEVNGIIDVDGDMTMANGHTAEGEHNVPPAPPRTPRFYDVDLEKMHVKLYYGGFLTPKEFMNDLVRIVANAEVEPVDNERLFKAQFMYTGARTAILSWEPQFNVECERMASREYERRRQREQRKGKSKVGNKVPSVDEPYAPGTRRSARNNGQEPEMPYHSDPLQLERNLKRQRGEDWIVGPTGSDKESAGEQPSTPKRIRTSEEVDRAVQVQQSVVDGADMPGPQQSLNMEGDHLNNVHEAPHVDSVAMSSRNVRFAAYLGQPNLHAESSHITPNGIPAHTGEDSHLHDSELASQPLHLDWSQALPLATEPAAHSSVAPNFLHLGESSGNDHPTSGLPTSSASHSTLISSFESSHLSADHHIPNPMSISHISETNQHFQHNAVPPPTDIDLAMSTQENPPPRIDVTMDDPNSQQEMVSTTAASPPQSPPPSTPPPPPPSFHVNTELLAQLETQLLDRTSMMNVEQLEQLRAMLLSCIWQHRADWDREILLRDMVALLEDFERDITADSFDLSSP